jgi:hypothetical protein
LSFDLVFDAPGGEADYRYRLAFQQPQHAAQSQGLLEPVLFDELLCLGDRTLFHVERGKWQSPP